LHSGGKMSHSGVVSDENAAPAQRPRKLPKIPSDCGFKGGSFPTQLNSTDYLVIRFTADQQQSFKFRADFLEEIIPAFERPVFRTGAASGMKSQQRLLTLTPLDLQFWHRIAQIQTQRLKYRGQLVNRVDSWFFCRGAFYHSLHSRGREISGYDSARVSKKTDCEIEFSQSSSQNRRDWFGNEQRGDVKGIEAIHPIGRLNETRLGPNRPNLDK
jgi:hypothetical protein